MKNDPHPLQWRGVVLHIVKHRKLLLVPVRGGRTARPMRIYFESRM